MGWQQLEGAKNQTQPISWSNHPVVKSRLNHNHTFCPENISQSARFPDFQYILQDQVYSGSQLNNQYYKDFFNDPSMYIHKHIASQTNERTTAL